MGTLKLVDLVQVFTTGMTNTSGVADMTITSGSLEGDYPGLTGISQLTINLAGLGFLPSLSGAAVHKTERRDTRCATDTGTLVNASVRFGLSADWVRSSSAARSRRHGRAGLKHFKAYVSSYNEGRTLGFGSASR